MFLCGSGVTVEPGDVIVGDADGLIRVPAAQLHSAPQVIRGPDSEGRTRFIEQIRSKRRPWICSACHILPRLRSANVKLQRTWRLVWLRIAATIESARGHLADHRGGAARPGDTATRKLSAYCIVE